MSKYNISINVDIAHVAPELVEGGKVPTSEEVEAALAKLILEQARRKAQDNLRTIQRDPDMDHDVKVIKMGEEMRKLMASIMAEANMTATQIPQSTVIQTELPWEQRYAA